MEIVCPYECRNVRTCVKCGDQIIPATKHVRRGARLGSRPSKGRPHLHVPLRVAKAIQTHFPKGGSPGLRAATRGVEELHGSGGLTGTFTDVFSLPPPCITDGVNGLHRDPSSAASACEKRNRKCSAKRQTISTTPSNFLGEHEMQRCADSAQSFRL